MIYYEIFENTFDGGIAFVSVKFCSAKGRCDFEKALTEAKAKNKNVLLMFHASWCKWCHTMENNMKLPETKPVFEKNLLPLMWTCRKWEIRKNLKIPAVKS
uniref:Thioredoxin family protein n=1 Tax=Chryseobacterium endophyticum TaxID=1854762 RepID=A0AAU6WN83_9FLAO